MIELLHFVFASGFFENSQVRNAIFIGGGVAAISGILGVFVIIRGQAFAGHAISDFGGAGAAVAFLLGINTLWGFLVFGVLSSLGVELIGKRAHERDLATGVVLSFALGIESLFLFLDTHDTGQSGAPMMILFGSIFIMNSSLVPIILGFTVLTLLLFLLIFRPLLTCSIDQDFAKTRGIPVKLISYFFIVLLALVVDESSLVIGALLSTALLVGPAATAMRLTRNIKVTLMLSAVLSVIAMWLGIILAYDSYLWLPSHRSWPVSFFVCALILLFYFISRCKNRRKKGEKKNV